MCVCVFFLVGVLFAVSFLCCSVVLIVTSRGQWFGVSIILISRRRR